MESNVNVNVMVYSVQRASMNAVTLTLCICPDEQAADGETTTTARQSLSRSAQSHTDGCH